MKTRRILTGVLASAMILSTLTVSASATNELSGKWYEADMNLWISRGVITGDEYGYRAEDYITRGEMATMINRVLQYQTYAYNTFYDLPSDQYYTQPMLCLVQAGILTGDVGNMMLPNAPITREEAVTMMARTLQIDKYVAPVAGFVDQYMISPYAQNAVNAMVASGYIVGDEYGFRPQDPITRAEVATMMTRVFDGSFYPTPTYPSVTPNYSKDVVVTTAGAKVEDLHITGDLFITASVGTGSVYLEDLIVDGDIIIQGTSSNNVHLKDVEVLGSIYDVKTKGNVKLYLTGSTDVDDIFVSNYVLIDADGLNSYGDLDNIEITDDDATLTLVDGDVNTIDINSAADNADVNIQYRANVNTITVDGEDADISGSGDVDRIKVYADDADIDTDGTRVDIASGVDGTKVNGRTYSGNRTVYSNGWYDNDNDDDECRVRFYVGDTLYKTIWVDEGDRIKDYDSMPDEPTKNNKEFAGWVDADGDAFKSNTRVYDNMSVYATWDKITTDGDTSTGGDTSTDVTQKFVVTVYENKGDSKVADTIKVKETASLYDALMALDIADEEYFKGWKTSSGEKITADTKLTSDISVYATWYTSTSGGAGVIFPSDEGFDAGYLK